VTTLSIDFETWATLPLPKTGVYRYAQHPDTDIWCMAWDLEGEEPEIWTPNRDLSEPPECVWCGHMATGFRCMACGGPQNAHLPPNVVDHSQAGDEIRA
jgi:hypothetical protein